MTDTPWTAGPWVLMDVLTDYPRVGEMLTGIEVMADRQLIHCHDLGFDNGPVDMQIHANARLIAAAPDMAEALLNTRNRLYNAMIVLGSSPEFALEGCREADAAIAKARGAA